MYAPAAILETTYGQGFLEHYLSGVPDDQRLAFIDQLLSAASGRIDAALESGGYPAPVTAADALPALADEVMNLLAFHCVNLAVGQMGSAANDLPGGAKSAVTASESWLKELAAGRLKLVGVSRSTEEVQARASGNVLFVPAEDRPSINPRFHAAISRLY